MVLGISSGKCKIIDEENRLSLKKKINGGSQCRDDIYNLGHACLTLTSRSAGRDPRETECRVYQQI